MFTARFSRRRRGATAVEFAIVAPVVFLLLFAQIVGGLGVFCHDEVAHLARDGARYASTHGGMYQQEGVEKQTNVPAITSSDDIRNYLTKKVALLDPSKMQVAVSWTAPTSYVPPNMPSYADTNLNLIPPGQSVIQNHVIVTVRYQWFPKMFLVGPIELSSTSNMPMSY